MRWDTACALCLIAGGTMIWTGQPGELIVLAYGAAFLCFIISAIHYFRSTPPHHTGKD